MAYMGTIVTNGRATGTVVTTGMSTEMGKIATGIQEIEPEQTPLQKNIAKLSRYLGFPETSARPAQPLAVVR